ncbi:unnamed protein product [Caenorhabditis bovis]|uniref:C2H2-type domain-containing protein n=1 Tax=Caenorhabditis bovis TaxID=2654633 RepID=A0A8S1F574_9PELO|nr:unnamed protein product [Caenorhabditis bovis]
MMVSSGDSVEIEQIRADVPDHENTSDSEDIQKIEKLKAENRLMNDENVEIKEDSNESNGGMQEESPKSEGPEKNGVTNGCTNGASHINNNEQTNDGVCDEKPKNGSTNSNDVDNDIEEIVIDEDVKKPEENVVNKPSTSKENELNNSENKRKAVEVECIELDDDDDDVSAKSSAPPPFKKIKPSESTDDDEDIKVIPKHTEEKKKEPELTSPEALLNKLEEYVTKAIDGNVQTGRKLLDALLNAINVQVQREPFSVRKLILEKKLVLPNTISFPPSQVVDLLIEHDPDNPLNKVINKMFGEERPKLSEAERKERQAIKANNPVPGFTKLLMDIGQDLVQESTYCDIVHAKNLPETPKNVETYKQVAQQLKPVWETLKRKNEPYKLKTARCHLCGFQSESRLVMSRHKSTLHHIGSKFQCTFCKEIDTNEQRMLDHYLDAHLIVAIKEEKEAKFPCPICEEDFNFKGVREQHYKQCKKDYIRVRNIMAPKADDILHINRWLWEKPPVDPTILQQQQAQQAKKHSQAAQQMQAIRAKQLQAQQMLQQKQLALLKQQQQQQQQRQFQQLLQRGLNLSNLSNKSFLSVIQKLSSSGNVAQQAHMAALIQKQIAEVAKQTPNLQASLAAAAAAQQRAPKTPVAPTKKPTPITPANSVACEICDQSIIDKDRYLAHLQCMHKQMIGKNVSDMSQGAPLACSRCRFRFWTYEGLERHLVMSHGLVTADLLQKAQKKEDGGRCKLCGKQYAFNMLQHLVADHQVKLCSAEIMYSCDVCSFKCTSYQTLEAHLTSNHPKGAATDKSSNSKKDDCIVLDE